MANPNRHDTPVDGLTTVVPAADVALARARQLETIESAYERWRELVQDQRARRLFFASEYRRLDDQGSLLLGAVGATQAPSTGDGLQLYLNESRLKLDAARADLVTREARELSTFELAIQQMTAEVRSRVKRSSELVKPSIHVMPRSMPEGRRILHATRLGNDEALTAFFVLTDGHVPSRYGYLFDDSTDDLTTSPPWLYDDESVAEVRPTPAALKQVLEARVEVWPAKGMVPMFLPGDRHLVRWLQRGAVMELEVADGEAFRNLLTQQEAERALGALISLKLAGRIELELS